MSIILDVVIVAIIALSVFVSAKRGFVRTLIDVIGFVVAIVIAFTFSSPLAELTYSKAIEPTVSSKINETVFELINDTSTVTEANLEKLMSSLPNSLKEILQSKGYSPDVLFNKLNSAVDEESFSTEICNNIIQPAITSILKYIYTILIFIILLIIIKFLSKFLNSLFKGAILGTANLVLGGALGAIKGAIYVTILCMALTILSHIGSPNLINVTISEAIDSSYICKTIIRLLPFSI